MAFEVRNKFHVLGGVERGRGVNLELCLSLCFVDSNCAGIDFDSRGGICHTFVQGNTCDPLIPKDYCVHVSRIQCSEYF